MSPTEFHLYTVKVAQSSNFGRLPFQTELENAPVNFTIVVLSTLQKYAPQKGVRILKIKLLPEWGLIIWVFHYLFTVFIPNFWERRGILWIPRVYEFEKMVWMFLVGQTVPETGTTFPNTSFGKKSLQSVRLMEAKRQSNQMWFETSPSFWTQPSLYPWTDFH